MVGCDCGGWMLLDVRLGVVGCGCGHRLVHVVAMGGVWFVWRDVAFAEP